jgi:hypothetical protein
MKPGSVIVDMAIEQGGNCPLTELGKTVVKHGVHIIGEPNLPALVAADASALYARNVLDFLKLIVDKDGKLAIDREDEIVRACWCARRRSCCANNFGRQHHGNQSHHHQPDHLRAGDLRRLPRGLDRHPGAAHAADGGDQRDLGHHHRRRHAGRRPDRRAAGQVAGTLAVALAAVNVFGGFLVTQRMLEMFKKKEPKARPPKPAAHRKEGGCMNCHQHECGHAAVPGGVGLLHPGA